MSHEDSFNNHNKLLIYAELKPQLASAQIFLTFRRNSCKRSITLNIKKTSIEVKWSKKNQHKLTFDGVQFVPTTCHSMQWMTGDTLHFRVQIFDKCASNGRLVYDPDPAKDVLQSFQSDAFTCVCAKCHHIFIEKHKFKRVLPLPSDNWYEMADSVFCCKHKHKAPENPESSSDKHNGHTHNGDSPVDEGLSLCPREGDCLVGDTHFLVHGHSVIQQNVVVDDVTGNVQCSRCKFLIGQTMKPPSIKQEKNGCIKAKTKVMGLKVFSFSVQLVTEPIGDNQLTAQPAVKSLALEESLAELIMSHSKRYNNYRFVIESKLRHTVQPYLLVWLLDAKCYQLSGETGDEATECVVQSQQVVKLMYTDCLRDKNTDISEKWCKDLTVLSIDLPRHCCLQLADILSNNTRRLPSTARQQTIEGTDFYVGYLKKEQSKKEKTGKSDAVQN